MWDYSSTHSKRPFFKFPSMNTSCIAKLMISMQHVVWPQFESKIHDHRTSLGIMTKPKKWSGHMWACEYCHAPTGNFLRVWQQILAGTIYQYSLLLYCRCCIDCSIRVLHQLLYLSISLFFAKFPMAESDLAKTELAGPLAMTLL